MSVQRGKSRQQQVGTGQPDGRVDKWWVIGRLARRRWLISGRQHEKCVTFVAEIIRPHCTSYITGRNNSAMHA